MMRLFLPILVLLLLLPGCEAEQVETEADLISGRFRLSMVNNEPLPATVSAGAGNSIVVTDGTLILDTIRDFEVSYFYTVSGQRQQDLFTGKWSVSEGRLTLRNENPLFVFPDNEASCIRVMGGLKAYPST
ncbi:MAG: hypothetical protein O3C45_03450 [Bacteroidetes bacterium]|nr:hypothetical protein [Bacteroidota bacterium]